MEPATSPEKGIKKSFFKNLFAKPEACLKTEIQEIIEEHEEDVMNDVKYATQVRSDDNMENLYKLIQVPLLVGILYFAFQLPVTRKYILKFVPSVFNADGNFNISGLVFMSALFALGYFGLTKLLDCVETL
jgi:hypothetical protein